MAIRFPSPTRLAGEMSYLYRSLKHRNYRLFFFGQILSLIGTWLATVATSWLVYRLARETMPERAAEMLGLVGFSSMIPAFVIAPFAGVWVDRLDKHKILVATQVASMIQSFILAYLALTHQVTILQVVALSLFQGFVNAFDMPARQSFVIEMVEDRADLANAIALNSSMVHTARLVGPAIGGFLIYYIGEGGCFLIDGLSYLAVIFALLAMHPRKIPQVPHLSALTEMLEGIRYAVKFDPIRSLLLMVTTASLMFTTQSVLMPIIADKILMGNERTLGFLLGASGLGALCGSLYLASRKTVVGLGYVIRNATLVLGVGFICLCFSRSVALSLFLLMVCGTSMVLLNASCNTLLQTISDDDKRGRVMSFFTLCFLGMSPFASLIAGGLASRIGAPWTFAFCGCVCIVSGLFFARKIPKLRELVRPIFIAKGIIPPVEPPPPT